MEEFTEVNLPSGAKLKLALAPFAESKALYQSVAAEGTSLKLDPKAEVDVNFFKDLFCVALASPVIEANLWVCMKRCLYNGAKITPETFESKAAREDYMDVMFEVAKENIEPFTKSLYAKYEGVLSMLQSTENPK